MHARNQSTLMSAHLLAVVAFKAKLAHCNITRPIEEVMERCVLYFSREMDQAAAMDTPGERLVRLV